MSTTKTIDDGGPAFPLHDSDHWEGMSMRDYFAIHAPSPSEFMRKHLRELEHGRMLGDRSRMYQSRDDEKLEAEWRYKFADAMLEARAK